MHNVIYIVSVCAYNHNHIACSRNFSPKWQYVQVRKRRRKSMRWRRRREKLLDLIYFIAVLVQVMFVCRVCDSEPRPPQLKVSPREKLKLNKKLLKIIHMSDTCTRSTHTPTPIHTQRDIYMQYIIHSHSNMLAEKETDGQKYSRAINTNRQCRINYQQQQREGKEELRKRICACVCFFQYYYYYYFDDDGRRRLK